MSLWPRTPARNSFVQQTLPIDLKEPVHKAITETLLIIYDRGCLPRDAELTHVADGYGLEQKSSVNTRAKFHTTCNLEFSKNDLKPTANPWRDCTLNISIYMASMALLVTQALARTQDKMTVGKSGKIVTTLQE